MIYRSSQRRASGLALRLLVLLISLLVSSVAFAHEVELIRSEPAEGQILSSAPATVSAWFSEEIRSGESTLTVINTEGEAVDNGDGGVDLNDPVHASLTVTLPPLADGVYTVRWHALLLDGDTTDGAFAFGVGAGIDPSEVVALPASTGSGFNLSTATLAAAVLLSILFLGMVVVLWRRRA